MKRLLLLALLWAPLLHADWYDTDWGHRLSITVDAAEVTGDLTDFPVYLDLGQIGSGHGFWSNVQSDGDDIRITKSDETTEVPFEVVDIDTTGKTGEVHFKATGTLSSSVDTVFYLYYGNDAASMPAEDATYGSENVWTSCDQVYHFKGTSYTDIDDSTAGDYDVDETNGTVSYEVTGDVGDSVEFLLTSHIGMGSFPVYDTGFSFTLRAKMGFSGAFFGTDANLASGYICYAASNDLRFYRNDGGWKLINTSPTFVLDTWYTISGYWDGSDMYLYLDGTELGTLATSGSANLTSTDMNFGRRGGNSWNADCAISEARFSENSNTMSEDWHVTEHNNLSSPSAFYSIGTQEDEPSGGGVTGQVIITSP